VRRKNEHGTSASVKPMSVTEVTIGKVTGSPRLVAKPIAVAEVLGFEKGSATLRNLPAAIRTSQTLV